MATKRALKKAVKATCGYMAGECIVARELIPGIDVEKMDQAVVRIADLQFDTIRKVSFSFDKSPRSFENAADYRKARRQYFHKGYAKLRHEFEAGIDEVIAMMNQTLPANRAEKEA